tara:strand:- start:9557 stop:9982 length:426 start_codon:yes stop_codon:yes gene_type:complete
MIIKSSKAIITVNNKYLLQLRDNKKNIFFPGFWGLFGGRLDKNELHSKAIKREINEETNLKVIVKKKILTVDFSMVGLKKERNIIYFDCKVLDSKKIILSEGRKYNFFSFNQIRKLRIVPMDFVAINCHYHNNKNFISFYR